VNVAIYNRFSSSCISYNGVIWRILNTNVRKSLCGTCTAHYKCWSTSSSKPSWMYS